MRTLLLGLAAAAVSVPGSGRSQTAPGRAAGGLAYEVAGTGPPVVLIHGAFLDRRQWTGTIAALATRFRVVAYDLRGHGRSTMPATPFAPWDDLAALIEELGEERVALVGVSDGARIAVDFALTYPSRVDRIVLAAPSVGGYVPAAPPDYLAPMVAALRAGDIDAANEHFLATPILRVPERFRPLVRSMVEGNRDLWGLDPALQQTLDPPALERLDRVAAATLVLVGEHDVPDMHAIAEILGDRIPNVRVRTVAGGGHLLNLTSAGAFAEAVVGFLSGGR